jgi:hypothetical protein
MQSEWCPTRTEATRIDASVPVTARSSASENHRGTRTNTDPALAADGR